MAYIRKDDKVYSRKEDVPNLGSLVCTSQNGSIRNYEGLAADADKLPTYDDLATGSSFFAVDTGDLYKYEKTTKTWYKL